MMYRRYPKRKQGEVHASSVTSIRFSPAARAGVAEVHRLLSKRWKFDTRPSLSLLLEAVVIRWADEMRNDPKAITELKNEILARGYHPQAFRIDGNPEKLAELVDQVAKTGAVMETEDILRSRHQDS